MVCLRAKGLPLWGFQTKVKKENVLFLGHETDSKQRNLYYKVLNIDSIKHLSLHLALSQISRTYSAHSRKRVLFCYYCFVPVTIIPGAIE